MLRAILTATLAVLFALSTPASFAGDRDAVAGVYAYVEGDLLFVLRLPKEGTVEFSIYRSVPLRLETVITVYGNPAVTNGTFSLREDTFRLDEIKRKDWPPHTEVTLTHYMDKKGDVREGEWRMTKISSL